MLLKGGGEVGSLFFIFEGQQLEVQSGKLRFDLSASVRRMTLAQIAAHDALWRSGALKKRLRLNFVNGPEAFCRVQGHWQDSAQLGAQYFEGCLGSSKTNEI